MRVSKTDKTKPWRVRVMEHNPWANHDHSDGICDLPAHYKDNSFASTESGSSHCRWSDWNIVYKGNCCYGCGCRNCTGRTWRRRDRRRARHHARSEAHRILKLADWENWCPPQPRHPPIW